MEVAVLSVQGGRVKGGLAGGTFFVKSSGLPEGRGSG